MLRFFLRFASIALLLTIDDTFAYAIDQADLKTQLNQLLDDDATAKRTTVALKVVDLKSGKVVYDRHGERLITPASNLKIYTSACALDTFGPAHCFPTKITAAVSDQGDILGDLRIVGGGNAMLSTADLRHLADRIVDEWGVRSVHGQVVIDISRYSDTTLGPGWMWDDQPYYFNMRVTPLMLDFNVRTLPGQFDADGDPVRRAIADPPRWIAIKFADMLRARGVKIEATKTNSTTNEQKTIAYRGTPLAATLKHFNHVSENAVGEVLLHEIAIADGKQRPSWSHGAATITNWLHNTAGLERESFKLVDGSGLSRYNLISADSSVKLLAFMRKHPHYRTFYESLPAYGVATGAGERTTLVRAKPGGMSGVSTISGYLETVKGRELTFSLLANGYIGSSKPIRDLRGRVWALLAKYDPATN